jgi:hypothetical protein
MPVGQVPEQRRFRLHVGLGIDENVEIDVAPPEVDLARRDASPGIYAGDGSIPPEV